MMSRKGIRAEILEVVEVLESNIKMTEYLYGFYCGMLKAYCEVLDGDLFAKEPLAGRFLDEDYIVRIEKFINLD